jgi:5-methylcytosine-specific restriction enzyme A
MPLNLVPEQIYRRRDLHAEFGGQRQGGISTPADAPAILLFTGFTGLQHGYEDGWAAGVFCYFGEGQIGDMPWVRGNQAVRDHAENGRDLLLFQMLKEPRAHVKYLGSFAAASWEYRQAPDQKDQMRRAIVFHLLPTSTEDAVGSAPGVDTPIDLAAVRRAAQAAGSDAPHRETRQAYVTYIQRSAAIRDYALNRAAGSCERCEHKAPFLTSSGAPFLEVHHIRRLTDGGPDRLDAVAALCPNCHREAHHGSAVETLRETLIALIAIKELALSKLD